MTVDGPNAHGAEMNSHIKTASNSTQTGRKPECQTKGRRKSLLRRILSAENSQPFASSCGNSYLCHEVSNNLSLSVLQHCDFTTAQNRRRADADSKAFEVSFECRLLPVVAALRHSLQPARILLSVG